MVGNDNLLELKNGRSLTFYRQKSSGSSLADNNSAGRINICDSALASPDRIALTVVHEVAHNWNTEHADWNNWMKRSGWTNKNPQSSSSVKGKSTSETWWHKKYQGVRDACRMENRVHYLKSALVFLTRLGII